MVHLQCDAIAKSFGARAVLRDVDLAVPAGTLTAILGSSGSGKTTLLRVIIGFLEPDAGAVTIGGLTVAVGGRKSLAPNKRAVGYVAQEGALYPHLRVGENVGFGLSRAERRSRTRIVEVLELVGLGADHLDRRPHELSGGEQRRVALARACAAASTGVARRAVLRARRVAQGGDARGGPARADGRREHGGDGHPRSSRGAVDGTRGGRTQGG